MVEIEREKYIIIAWPNADWNLQLRWARERMRD